jgi:hypothetical protein
MRFFRLSAQRLQYSKNRRQPSRPLQIKSVELYQPGIYLQGGIQSRSSEFNEKHDILTCFGREKFFQGELDVTPGCGRLKHAVALPALTCYIN